MGENKWNHMKIIDDITNFIFVEDIPAGHGMENGDSAEEANPGEGMISLAEADVIFIPGGSYPELPERAAQLWKAGHAPYVVPSGRYSITIGRFTGVKSKAEKYSKDYVTECEFYTDVLQANGVAPDCIIQEDEARFTAENARFSRKALEARGIRPKKAIICCKAYHSRRCLMYYQLCFPDTEFLIAPACGKLTRENWYRTEPGLQRVLGELARLGTQFTPEHTPEIADLLCIDHTGSHRDPLQTAEQK